MLLETLQQNHFIFYFTWGSHDGWEAGYWFKSNPEVEGSFYHQMDFTKLHILNEALLSYDRTRLSPIEGTATQFWGISSQLQWDHNLKWGSFYRYEFTDPSDGLGPNDNFQALTVGGIFHPDPKQYPGLKVPAEYVRTLEEGIRNTFHNDVFYTQLQMVF